MQFGFRPGKKAADAIFNARQMQGCKNKGKKPYYASVEPKNAFNRVPRDGL